MPEQKPNNWEPVSWYCGIVENTWRMLVPGGWIEIRVLEKCKVNYFAKKE